jgi:ribose transport system permease protein
MSKQSGAPEAEPSDERKSTASARRLSEFIATYGLAIVLVAVLAVFGALRPTTFLGASNINNLLISQSVTALLALAEMIPLATNRFDMSVGYHVGMAQVLVIGLQILDHLPWEMAIVVVLFIGALIGLINGVLITVFKIDAFIATMGVGTLLYGVSNWYSGGQQIVGMDLSPTFTGLVRMVGPIPLPALYVAVVAIALWIVTEYMPVGRNLYVIGANPRAAALTGIHVERHVIGAFVASGLLASIAGIILGSILQTGTPSVGAEYLLPAFAGALLGATSIRPGRVNVGGTILAVLVLATSFSGVEQMGASFYVEYFFNGGILILAVGLSVYATTRRRRMANEANARTAEAAAHARNSAAARTVIERTSR